MNCGSLFSGIGGFDVGLNKAGIETKWQVEINKHANKVLKSRFSCNNWDDVLTFPPDQSERWHVDIICGGDPCPYRSRSSHIHGTDQPDLWPEFLRVVSVLRPLWVLREHVVSGDTDRCGYELYRRGYTPIVLEMDGAEITGQSRPREFLCGVLASSGICPGHVFSEPECNHRDSPSPDGAAWHASCLTTNPKRFDYTDNYILEEERGTRILSPVERERLMGFDDGWTDGLSDGQRARVLGNALITHKAEFIGRCIMRRGQHNAHS